MESRFPRMRAEVVELFGRSRLVSFRGDLDGVGARVMAEVFARTTPASTAVDVAADVAVDLTAVELLSAAGAAVLYDVGVRAGAAGGRLVIASPPGAIARSLVVCRRSAGTSVVDSRAAALAALGVTGTDLPAPAPIDVIGMRNRVFIAQALAILRDRYGLADTDAAFQLVCAVSQRHNVSVRTLAGAVLDLRPPAGDRWFPGRRRAPYPPPLSFHTRAPTPRATFTAALDAIACPRGAVHSVDPFHGGLVLEHHRGLPVELTDHLAVVDSGTASTLAQQTGRPIVVDDVATDPRLGEDTRAALLRAGVRAARSIPLLARNRDCLGVVTIHHPEPQAPPPTGELTAVVVETGRWLDWYRRAVVFDALERLHQQATAGRRHTVRSRRRSRS